MPVLDTNFLIRLEQGDAVASSVLASLVGQALAVPAHVVLEVAHGADDVDQTLDGLYAAFSVELPDHTHLRLASHATQASRETSRPRTGDAWIAAHALARGDFVVSTNKRHFTQLGVRCWNYEKEPHPPAPAP